ncbi:MAG: hypothetical protein HQL21_03180 [Candidatus Omnitrophica bacterium]|nr:hypothetical protein [Candidatus Omnitrophota bacterium]
MMSDNILEPQPLDAVMGRLNLSNADLVHASREQLSFKMVQKGRKGKPLSLNIQNKILRALKAARPEEPVSLQDLFNY